MERTSRQQPTDNLTKRFFRWVRATWLGKVVGVAVVVALIFLLYRLLYWWPDSGLSEYPINKDVERAKTLWDWLDLLGVPVVLAVGGFAFSRAERKNEQEIAAQRAEQDRVSANKRATLDRELANTRAKAEQERADDALRQALVQDYLDRMSELLLNRSLASSKEDDLVREVARARTLTVLQGLGKDGARKGYIVQFLYETGLIRGKELVVDLRRAKLQMADLSYLVLREVNLSVTNLSGAFLGKSLLMEAYLNGAILIKANLGGADLSKADLGDSLLIAADLSGAILIKANLGGADLSGADLSGADLSGADLREAKVTNEQLTEALSLEGATMPDGSKYAGVPPTAGATSAPSPDTAAQGGPGGPTT